MKKIVPSSRGTSRKLRPAPTSSEIRLLPIAFSKDIHPGESLLEELMAALRQGDLSFEPGDILVVKHKIVSKAEGQLVDLAAIQPSRKSAAWARQHALDPRLIELALRESRAILRRRQGVLITETHHGFLCANSGVDVSNVDGGKHALLLPVDPDRSARTLHRQLKQITGFAIPVLITDTFGRPWREGLVDFCIGIAGMKPLRDDRGQRDPHGYTLHASLEAIADELAAAAGLLCGKLNRTPACIVRGFRHQPGQGRTRDLLRPAAIDLFR